MNINSFCDVANNGVESASATTATTKRNFIPNSGACFQLFGSEQRDELPTGGIVDARLQGTS